MFFMTVKYFQRHCVMYSFFSTLFIRTNKVGHYVILIWIKWKELWQNQETISHTFKSSPISDKLSKIVTIKKKDSQGKRFMVGWLF